MSHFKGKQFEKDIIMVTVGYYLRYNLSYRDVSEILNERGINVCHTIVYRWVQEYSKVIYCIWKKRNKSFDDSCIKVKGKWHYLYRAIDSSGITLDVWLRKNVINKQLMLSLND